MGKYRSYWITIRPREGLKEKTEIRLKKWLQKQEHGMGCIEKENEARHAHIQIWNEEARERGVIVKSIRRICEETIEDWDSAQSKVMSNGIKIAYDNVCQNYCIDNELKNGEEIFYDKCPDITEKYYPTEEEQEKVKEEANTGDIRYYKMNENYIKWKDKKNLCKIRNQYEIKADIASFLSWSMFEEKNMKIIQDPRVAKQVCYCLWRYHLGLRDSRHFMYEGDYDKLLAEAEMVKRL